jgi:hypothetical protein
MSLHLHKGVNERLGGSVRPHQKANGKSSQNAWMNNVNFSFQKLSVEKSTE